MMLMTLNRESLLFPDVEGTPLAAEADSTLGAEAADKDRDPVTLFAIFTRSLEPKQDNVHPHVISKRLHKPVMPNKQVVEAAEIRETPNPAAGRVLQRFRSNPTQNYQLHQH